MSVSNILPAAKDNSDFDDKDLNDLSSIKLRLQRVDSKSHRARSPEPINKQNPIGETFEEKNKVPVEAAPGDEEPSGIGYFWSNLISVFTSE